MKSEEWQELKAMELDDWLSFIDGDDALGITVVKAKSRAPKADELLVAKFLEINDFYKAKGRVPKNNQTNMSELMLHKRLNAISANDKQCHALVDFDEFGLLPLTQMVAEPKAEYKPEVKEINSVEDIFADDDFGLLGDSENSIYNIKHIKAGKRAESDFVARRKPISDFALYSSLFKGVHSELKTGERVLEDFTEKDISPERYFVMDGVLLFIESIEYETKTQSFDSGSRVRKDGRTKVIFENGTYSKMLHRSLYKQLLKGGKTVSHKLDAKGADKKIGVQDTSSGFIYVLSSQSEDSQILSIPNLYKIGYSTTPVEKRIANAAKEATYLMAPVNIVASFECYNMNTQKFENLIHTVFKDVVVDVEVADLKGIICRPREWFSVPLDQIDIAVNLIVSGQIVSYRYNRVSSLIELK